MLCTAFAPMTMAVEVGKAMSEGVELKEDVVCIHSRAVEGNVSVHRGTLPGMGDQAMHGSRFRTFHVSMTAPPFEAAWRA